MFILSLFCEKENVYLVSRQNSIFFWLVGRCKKGVKVGIGSEANFRMSRRPWDEGGRESVYGEVVRGCARLLSEPGEGIGPPVLANRIKRCVWRDVGHALMRGHKSSERATWSGFSLFGSVSQVVENCPPGDRSELHVARSNRQVRRS